MGIQSVVGKTKTRLRSKELNNMEKVKILNAQIQSITEKGLLDSLKEGVLVTPNVDHLVKLQRDREFYDVYQKADVTVKSFTCCPSS